MSGNRPGLPFGFGRAFTLIELLVVMALISILVSILLPALSGARQRGRITKCRANLREIAAAALRYVSQHDDRFPVAADSSGGNLVFGNGHQYLGWDGTQRNEADHIWFRPINGELGLQPSERSASIAKIALCPTDAGAPGETGERGSLFEELGSSYPMNPILCQGRYADWRYRDGDISLSMVVQPARKVLAADHVAFGLTYDGYWTAIRPGWHDRLRPAAVVAFIDGHVDYVVGACTLKEWQWYGEANGPDFTRQLTRKVPWTVLPGCE